MINILPTGFNRNGQTGIFTPNSQITFTELYKLVTTDKALQDLTKKARQKVQDFKHYSGGDKDFLKVLKKKATNAKMYGVPHLQPSFSGSSFSQYLHIDIDKVDNVGEVFTMLCGLDCVTFAARTLSGAGVFALVKLENKECSPEVFEVIKIGFKNYLKERKCSLEIDDAVCFYHTRAVCADPFAYLNLDAKNFDFTKHITNTEATKSKALQQKNDSNQQPRNVFAVDFTPREQRIDKSEVREALDFLIAVGANFAKCHSDYFKVFAACCYAAKNNLEAYNLTKEVLKNSHNFWASDCSFRTDLETKDCEKASKYSPLYAIQQAQKFGFFGYSNDVYLEHEGDNVTDCLEKNGLSLDFFFNGFIIAKTGAGKTYFIRSQVKQGKKIILLVPTNQLCEDVAAEAKRDGIKCEVWDSKHKRDADLDCSFFVATYNSFENLACNLEDFKGAKDYILVLDEAHTISTDTYKTDKDSISIFQAITRCKHLFKGVVGLTATPTLYSTEHSLFSFKRYYLKTKTKSTKNLKIVLTKHIFNTQCKEILAAVERGVFVLLHLNSKGEGLEKIKAFLKEYNITFRCLNADTKQEDALLELVNNKVIEGVQVYICTNVVREGVSIKGIKEAVVVSCSPTTSANDLEQISNRFRESKITLVCARMEGRETKKLFFSFAKQDKELRKNAETMSSVLTKNHQREIQKYNAYSNSNHEAAKVLAGSNCCCYDKHTRSFYVCENLISGALNKEYDSYILDDIERFSEKMKVFQWVVEETTDSVQNLAVTAFKSKSTREVIEEVKTVLGEGTGVLCAKGERIKETVLILCKKYGNETILQAFEGVQTSKDLEKLEKRLKMHFSSSGPVRGLIDVFEGKLIEGERYERKEILDIYNSARRANGLLGKRDCWGELQNIIQVKQSGDKYVVKKCRFIKRKTDFFTTVQPLKIQALQPLYSTTKKNLKNEHEVLSYCPF
jgi:hypothetical protein